MSVPLGDVVLEATDIEKYFGDNHVLHGVSLAVRKHETVMLIGRSGSGKTTFLHCLLGLRQPDSGCVEVMGHDTVTIAASAMRRMVWTFISPRLTRRSRRGRVSSTVPQRPANSQTASQNGRLKMHAR